jgi:SsrA-binding protein
LPPKNSDKKEAHKSAANNRRASHRYEIIDTLEAGIVLTGPEVKSIRAGNINLGDGFVRIEGEQAWLWNVHIAPYAMGSRHVEQEPNRRRKLLMNRSEILKWAGKTVTKGLTIVPLEVYFNKRGRAKVKIALAKGKRGPDRREDLKRRTIGREIQREFAGKHRIR